MRICLIGNGLTVQSGHARPAYVLARSLLDMGHEVSIIAEKRPPERQAVEQALLEKLGLGDLKVERLFDGLVDLGRGENALIRELWRRFARVDVVHAFDLTTMWMLSRAFGGAFPCATVATVASDLYVDASDITRHGAGVILRVATHPPYLAAALAGERLLPRFLAVPDRVIATSAHTARTLARVAPIDHVREVPQGLSWKTYEGAGRRDGPPVFLYFGWLSALRGAGDVVDAYRTIAGQLPGARLKVAVRGVSENVEDRMLVKRYANTPGVEVSGFDEDVAGLLAGVDVAVLPFRSSFGYCQPAMTVLEAMAAGRAVISTPVGAAGEAVEDGVSGVLVPPGDVSALASAMLALARDPARRDALGAAARARVTARHDPTASAEATLAVYREALSTGAPRGSHWERYGAKASYSVPQTAKEFDATRFTGAAGEAFDALERAELERGLGPRPLSVLEAGAGTARFASHLARAGHAVVAAEVSGPMLDEAVRRLAHEGTAGRVRLVQADGYRLPFADGSFDAVVAIRVVNQIFADDDKAAFLAELFRVVRPGGLLFFDLINANSVAWLARPAGLIASNEACRIVEDELGGDVIRVVGRLVIPETALRLSPALAVPLLERVDSALSRVVPAFATRVYVTARKREHAEPVSRVRPALSPAQGMAVSAVMLVAYLLAAVSNYLFSVQCARVLGPDRFGALSAVLGLQVMLAMPVHGLTAGLTVLFARQRESGSPGETVTAVTVPAAVVGLGAALAAAVANESGAAEAFLHLHRPGVAYAAAWGLTLLVVTNFLRALQLTIGQVGACVAGIFVEAVARILLLTVVAVVPLTVTGALVVYYLPATAGLLAALWALRHALAHRPVPIDLVELVRLATRGTGAYVLVCLLVSADVPLARHFMDPVSAGLFAAASSIAKIALLISAAVVEPRLPAVASSEGRAQRDAIREVVLQVASLCGLWALVCVLVPAPVFRWMFGSEYAGMVAVVGPLTIAAAATGTMYAALKCLVVASLRWPAGGVLLAVLVQAGGLALWHEGAAQAANVCLAAAVVALISVASALP